MQQLKIPAIRREPQTPAVAGPPMTFPAMRDLRTTARSLPDWAASRAKWSGSRIEIGGRLIPVLPANIPVLTDAERAFLDVKTADLDRLIAPEAWPVVVDLDDAGRPVVVDSDQAKLILVTKMLMAKASANMTAEGAAARGESYMIALGDIPAWAVEQAIADWYRGAVPGVDKADFKWSPDSSLLRRIAKDALRHYEDLLADLRNVLAARPLAEITA